MNDNLEIHLRKAAYDYYSKEDLDSYRYAKGYNGFIVGDE